jgi:type II secretory ATPase GspE/PulE/Tfp pilus assembly ATPase PilB-like protein
LLPGRRFREAVLARADAEVLDRAAITDGLVPLAEAAQAAVASGKTTAADVVRALGAEMAGKMEAARDMAAPGK